MGRTYDQVPLPPDWHVAGLRTPVSIGMIKARDRHARHQEIAQDSILDHLDLCSGNAFIIVFVPASQPRSIQGAQRRIIGDGEKHRQYSLVQLFSEGLSFFVAALPLAFQPVPKHFMEEYAGGAAGE